MKPEEIFFQDEFQLLSWGDTSSRGRTVTFLIPEDAAEHPFKTERNTKGKTVGSRYAAVLIKLTDDDKPSSKTPSQMAFLLCKDPVFWHFLNERSFVTVDSEESARQCILEGCGAKSRSAFDKDASARSAWLQQFYNPFTAYQAALAHKALP